MDTNNIIQLIVSFVGGGISASIISALSNHRTQKKNKRIEEIRLQLENLYGPITFLSLWNAKLLEIANNIIEASHGILPDELKQAIRLGNQYVDQTKENNEKIIMLLEKYYSLIDPNDVKIVLQFVTDYVRMKTEVTVEKTLTPFQIYQKLGGISFIHPDFIKAMENHFLQLKKELDNLLN
jgi:hypothetical protein